MRGFGIVLAFVLASGCAKSVVPQFEAARAAALAGPGQLPRDWAPDAVLHLSPDLVDALLGAALAAHGTTSGTIDAGVAQLTPRLTVTSLELSPAGGRRGGPGDRACDDCLQVDATLDGTLGWSGLLGRGTTDLGVTMRFDAAFAVAAREDGVWAVTVAPRRVRDLKVDLGGAALHYAAVPVQDWVDDQLLARLGAIEVAELGSATLPLAAARIVPAGKTIQVQLRTASPSPGAVPTDRTRPEGDWQLVLSQDSLLDVARAAAFRHGEVGHDVVPEPTSLAIDGDGFVLGLRLWRVKGRGWWRDYTIRGTVRMLPRRIELVPGEVEEGDRSPGAVWVDPLAALGEGVILKTIEDALATSLPAAHRGAVEGLETDVDLDQVVGEDGLLTASGALQVEAAEPAKRRDPR